MSTPFFRNSLYLAAAAAVSLTGLSGTAFAAERIVRSVEVHIGDLDLSKANGRATLDRRIGGAVRKVCGGADLRNLREVADMNQCRSEAKASAKRATVRILAAAEQPEKVKISVGG